MPDFTKGKWSDEWHDPDCFDISQEAHPVTTRDDEGDLCLIAFTKTEADARLVATAPDMYAFVKKMHMFAHYYLDSRFTNIFKETSEILARIDGNEVHYD